MGEKAGPDEWASEGGEIWGKGDYVCFDLVLEGGDFFGNGGKSSGEWLKALFGCGEGGPAVETFLEEVGGLYKVVEGVDHLDNLEVFCFEFSLDSLLSKALSDVVEECEWVVVVFWIDVCGGESWFVRCVGTEGFEALFVNYEVGNVFSDFFFFEEDFFIIYFCEFGCECFLVFWEEYIILNTVVVY